MTLPHKIEISRPGYKAYSTTITPKLGVSSRLNVRLKTMRNDPYRRVEK